MIQTNMNIGATAKGSRVADDLPEAATKSKDPNDSDFATDLAQAGMASQAQSQSQSQLQTPIAKAKGEEGNAGAQAFAQLQSGQSAVGKAGLTEAEQGQQGQKPLQSMMMSKEAAASTKTGSAIAGLKPWSKEWVFGGALENKGGEVQPLFSGDAAAANPLSAILGGDAGTIQNLNLQGGSASAMSNAESSTTAAAGNLAWNGQGDLELEEVDVPAAPQKGPGGIGPLSGSEFVSTLSAIRGHGAQSGAGGQSGSGGQGKSGQQALNANLRVIEGGAKGKKGQLEEGFTGIGSLAAAQNPNGQLVDGVKAAEVKQMNLHVTQGAGAQERLSSDALSGLSTNLRSFAQQGGGEVRIKLHPENLGELHLRVSTRGDQVGLHIQASDERARKLIEDSMSHLKESLAGHNLSLSRVDIAVAPGAGQSMSGEQRHDQGNQQQSQAGFQDMMGRHPGQGGFQSQNGGAGPWSRGSRAERDGLDASQTIRRSSGFGASAPAARAGAAGSSRLDVRA